MSAPRHDQPASRRRPETQAPSEPPPLEKPSAALWQRILVEVRDALGRYPLSQADREDLAQKALAVVLARWETYRAEGGSLRQWIRGIARKEVMLLWRTTRRRDRREAEHGVLTMDRTPRTPEDDMALIELFDHLIAQVPVEQRRAVLLVEIGDHTFREAAAREGVSIATAHARYQAGMKALREAAARWNAKQKSLGLAPLPLSIPELLSEARRAPEVTGDGIVEPADRHEIPDFLRRTRLPQLLGTLGGGAVAGLIAGVMIGRAGAAAPPDPRPLPISEVVNVERRNVVTAPSAAAEVPTPAETPSRPRRTNPIARTVATAPEAEALDRLRAEQALLDRGRAALERSDAAATLEVLAEHERRFPRGQMAAARAQLREEACAQVGADAGPRCAARP